MERINKARFEGKTISKIVNDCASMVEFHFTDGSVAYLDAEIKMQNYVATPCIFSSAPIQPEQQSFEA